MPAPPQVLLTTTQIANGLVVAALGSIFFALLGGHANDAQLHVGFQQFARAFVWTLPLLVGFNIIILLAVLQLRGRSPYQ